MKRSFIGPMLALAAIKPGLLSSFLYEKGHGQPQSDELTKFNLIEAEPKELTKWDLIAIEKARLKRERKAAKKAKKD